MRTRSTAERRQDDREDRTVAIPFEQKLALMPAYEVLLYEPGFLQDADSTDRELGA